MRIWLFILAFPIVGCGTFKGGGDYAKNGFGYRGMGKYKPPSEYSTGIDAGDNTIDELRARERLNSREHYSPRSEFKLVWPVEFVRINRGFRPASDTKHSGVDLGGRRGMPILASHEGIVVYAGREFRGYGNMVLVEYDRQWATLYAHLDEIGVKEGTILQPGDPIGSMGDSGKTTGVHLHFELMRNRDPVDPLQWLTDAPRITKKKSVFQGRRAASRTGSSSR